MPPPQPRGQYPGDQLDYVEITADFTITSTTQAGATAIITGNELVLDGATRICIEFYTALASCQVDNNTVVNLWDASTDLGRIAQITGVASTGTADVAAPVLVRRLLTPSAGRHTYIAKGWKTGAGNCVIAAAAGSFLPAYLRITVA